jgi:CheY-like chemotaxis protein
MARALGIRQSSLDVMFKRAIGQTPGNRLRQVRLDRAMCLLQTTLKSVKEVWSESGYGDASTFAHHFKKRFGVSASEYRRNVIRPRDTEPVHYRPVAHEVETAIQRPSHPRPCVLIVDDDQFVRGSTREYLAAHGFSTAIAEDGRRGLEVAVKINPDVVLTELHLPDMDGLTCLKRLLQLTGRPAPRVAIVTADRFVDELKTDAQALRVTIVSKLCMPATLGSLVQSLLEAGPVVGDRPRLVLQELESACDPFHPAETARALSGEAERRG